VKGAVKAHLDGRGRREMDMIGGLARGGGGCDEVRGMLGTGEKVSCDV